MIISTLKKFNKGTEAFQARWKTNNGQLLTGDILLETPMFWFMKYQWSRQEIEELFYKSRVVITDKFDRGLQETFGGEAGPRWTGGGGQNHKAADEYKSDNTR